MGNDPTLVILALCPGNGIGGDPGPRPCQSLPFLLLSQPSSPVTFGQCPLSRDGVYRSSTSSTRPNSRNAVFASSILAFVTASPAGTSNFTSSLSPFAPTKRERTFV